MCLCVEGCGSERVAWKVCEPWGEAGMEAVPRAFRGPLGRVPTSAHSQGLLALEPGPSQSLKSQDAPSPARSGLSPGP